MRFSKGQALNEERAIVNNSRNCILDISSICIALALVILVLLGCPSLAQASASASAETGTVELRASKFLDKTAQLDLAQVQAQPDSQWMPLKNQVTGYHFLDDDYWSAAQGAVLWLRLELPDSSRLNRIWLELLPNVGVDGKMAIHVDGRWHWQMPVQRLGPASTAPQIAQPARYLTFVLDTSREQKVVYLRLTSNQSFQFSLKARSVDQLLWYFLSSNLFLGLVAGMLLLAMIYNLAIGLKAKESIYLLYAFYVFCNLIYSMVTAGYTRLLFPEWGNTGIVSNITMLLIVFSVFCFLRVLLDTKESLPNADKALKTLMTISIICAFSVPFLSDLLAYAIALSIGIPSPLIALFVGILSYRQGHPLAKYFLVAWVLFLTFSMSWGWMWMGVVEPKEWVVQLYFIGTLVEILLLSTLLGFRFNSLKMQTKMLQYASSRYQTLSETDDLTKVLNRRGFIKEIERRVKTRGTDSMVWLALDIDSFKNFNDQHGHPAGDQLLEKVGALLNEKVRKESVVGRIGGEEFAILLNSCNLQDAQHFTDRLLADFSSLTVTSRNGEQVGSTLSIGATEFVPGESIEQVWNRADKLLYKAKDAGRNRVIAA